MLILANLPSSQYIKNMAHVEFELTNNDETSPELRLIIPRHLADAAIKRHARLAATLDLLDHAEIIAYETTTGERTKQLTVRSPEIGQINDVEQKYRILGLVNTTIGNLTVRRTRKKGPEPPLEMRALHMDGMFGTEAIMGARVKMPQTTPLDEVAVQTRQHMLAMARALRLYPEERNYESMAAYINETQGIILRAPMIHSSLGTRASDHKQGDTSTEVWDNNVGFNEEPLVYLAGLTTIANAD